MQLITQPHPSSICGHCCAAMVLDHLYPGLDHWLDAVVEAVGHRHGTWMVDLLRAFERYGVQVAPGKPIGAATVLPELCLVTLWYQRSTRRLGGHWILLYRGVVYDPSAEAPLPGEVYEQLPGRSLTSYYEILGYAQA